MVHFMGLGLKGLRFLKNELKTVFPFNFRRVLEKEKRIDKAKQHL